MCQSKQGMSFARETGVKVSQGRIVASTDADSIVPPNWLKNIWKKFREEKGIVAIAGPIDYLTGPRLVIFANSLFWKLQKIYFNLRKKLFFISAANFAFLKSAFKKCGGYNHSLPQGLSDQLAIFLDLMNVAGSFMFLIS